MEFFLKNAGYIFELFLDHAWLVISSMFYALIVSCILTIVTYKLERIYPFLITTLGVIYTIPSLALFAFLIPFLGLGFTTAVVALAGYSQMVLVRNMVTAIRGIDPAIIEAAKGMGMGYWRILKKIILPLGLPVIVAGIRIGTVMMIGIAAIAAYINAGGLGVLIFEGLAQNNHNKILWGAIALSILALLSDLIFRGIEKILNQKVWRRGEG